MKIEQMTEEGVAVKALEKSTHSLRGSSWRRGRRGHNGGMLLNALPNVWSG